VGKRVGDGGGLWNGVILGPQWGGEGVWREIVGDGDGVIGQGKIKKRFVIPNPLSCLSILLWKDTALIVFLASCSYAVWYTVLASIPQVYSEIYGWSELLVGIAFLPSAITVIIGGFVNGPWTNWRFRRTAHEAGISADSHHVDGFPIERARGRDMWVFLFGTYFGVAGLGWCIQYKAPVAVILVVQAVAGFLQVFLFLAFNTLLVDVHPDKPSTASAAASLVRSGLSGIGIAIVHPMVKIMGWGGYFTLLAGLVGALQGIAIVVLLKHGQGWRETRREAEKLAKKKEESGIPII
jgi:hypothetical protein